MIRDITIGQYYPADSRIHKLDPRVKIVCTLLYLISLFTFKSILGYVLATVFLFGCIKLAKVPFKFIVRGLKPIIILLLITVCFNLFLTPGGKTNWNQSAVKSILSNEKYNLSITSSSRPGGICAVSTLINIYEKYGFHTLDRVLRLCVATWEGAPMSFSSNMLNAIARLDNAYGETMKDDTFKEKVGRVSVREISRTARERRAGSLGFAEALLLEYNKKSKYSLPFEKLYTHKTPKKREQSTEDESGQSSTPEGQLDLFSTDQDNTQALPNE